MYKRNKLLKRLTAGALAVCIVLSIGGVGEIISSIMESFSVTANAAASTVPEDMSINDTIVFTDDMDALSTTVLFNHWHLMKDGGKTTAVGIADEYRFYPLKDENGDYIVSENDEGEDIIKVYLLSKVDGDTVGEFKLVEIYELDAAAPDYSKVSFVISPQIPNPLGAEGADEKFSNFSISSGHDSATIYLASDGTKDGVDNDFYDFKYAYGAVGEEHFVSAEYPDGKYPDGYARVVITYHPSSVNHVIKGHAFYVNDIVTMIGADFATEKFFTIPEDAKDYDTIDPDKNRLVENPYLVWEDGYTGKKNYESAGKAKIVYTGEIDTHYYKYKTADGRDKTVIYHNTSSGLHTNKTAYEIDGIDDGRTYDIELETWYAGEDIADVGFILDASGSMAWSTNVLQPMEVTADKIEALQDLLNKENKKLDDYVSVYNGSDGYTSTAQKYLTTDEVNTILNIANTDNTRLSYSEYNYYIYEPRASVSEFVALGYWGGNLSGTPSVDKLGYKLIGYYPFDGNLVNAISGLQASWIKNAQADSVFSDTPPIAEITPTVNKIDKGAVNANSLNLKVLAARGAASLTEDALPTNNNFTIALRMNPIDYDTNNAPDEAPILYIGDANQEHYINITRGGGSEKDSLIIRNENGEEIKCSNLFYNSDEAINKEQNKTPSSQQFTIYFVFDNGTFSILTNSNYIKYDTGISSMAYTFDRDKLNIILGGNIISDAKDYNPTNLQQMCVVDALVTSANRSNYDTAMKDIIAKNDTKVGSTIKSDYYFLGGSFKNEVTGKADFKYIKQPSETDGVFTDEIAGAVVDVSYTSDGKALNVTQISKNGGAVLLDAIPTDKDKYSISFNVKTTGTASPTNPGNIMYIGDLNTSETPNFRVTRFTNNSIRWDENRSGLPNDPNGGPNYRIDYGGVFDSTDWKTVTIVVDNSKIYTGDSASAGVTFYVNGAKVAERNMSPFNAKNDLRIILAGLVDEYNGADIYLDDLCVFDEPLSPEQVTQVYQSLNSSGADYVVASGDNLLAFDDSGNIIGTLNSGKNRYTDDYMTPQQRKGWYYINSNSTWTQTTDEKVGTAKQLEGLYNDPFAGSIKIKDIEASVTIPKAHEGTELFSNGAEKGNATFKYPETKDSSKSTYGPSQFFLVNINGKYYLRCYFNSGSHSSNAATASEARTQCSYIYYKADDQRIKVETLQYAINSFAANLKNESPRSRLSGVRFSNKATTTNDSSANFHAGEKDPSRLNSTNDPYYKNENNGQRLDHLVLLDWTKSTTSSVISARHGGDTAAGSNPSDPNIEDENNTKNDGYDPFVPISQQNYFLTGGTFTWTGLKAFYTQLASRDDRYYNGKPVTEEAEKYVILFTDGRDNTVSAVANINGVDKTKLLIQGDGVSDASATNYTLSYQGTTANSDKALINTPAKLWADKLKAEGYTVFCIMLASGSVSIDNNPSEYYTALSYLSYLIAGPAYENAAKTDADLITHYYDDDANNMDNYVFVANGDESLAEVFDAILARINSKLDDYTVQDYIDPRFDLVEEQEIASVTVHQDAEGKEIPEEECTHKDDVTYSSAHTHTIKLGAKGEIKLADCGTVYYKTTAAGKKTLIKVTDLPDGIPLSTDWTDTDPSGPLGNNNYYPYTALDGKQAQLYYDSISRVLNNDGQLENNDAYYLQWVEVEIPGCAIGAPIVEVWSSRIRIKAKDDFIGGNDILTNGNLANMNYVYPTKTIDKYIKGTKVTLELTKSSGTNKADPQLEKAVGKYTPAGAAAEVEYSYANYLPSKGFPRVAVNVRLLEIKTKNIFNEIYMGEAISPAQMLMDIEDEYMTDSYYLDYLRRYAYQRYLSYLEEYNEAFDKVGSANKSAFETALNDYKAASEAYKEAKAIKEAAEDELVVLNNGYPNKFDSPKDELDYYNEQCTETQKKVDELEAEIARLEKKIADEDYDDGETKETVTAELEEARKDLEAAKIMLEIWETPRDNLKKRVDEIIALEQVIESQDIVIAAQERIMEQRISAMDGYLSSGASIDYDRLITLQEQMDMPLIALLNEWLHINDNVIPKSFSIPYIYLPDVAYGTESSGSEFAGRVILGADKKASDIRNNTGNDLNRSDVVGILTYKWEQLDPVTGEPLKKNENGQQVDVDPTVEYVKLDTDSVKYSLTVEYTPLFTTDMPGRATPNLPIYSPDYDFKVDITALTEPDENGNEQPVEDNGKQYHYLKYNGGVDGYFADFLGIEHDTIRSTDLDELFDYFSRLASINGTLPSLTVKEYEDIHGEPPPDPPFSLQYLAAHKKSDAPDIRKDDGLIQEAQSDTEEISAFNSAKGVSLNVNVYRWNMQYKPAVGNIQVEYGAGQGEGDIPTVDIIDTDGTLLKSDVKIYGSDVTLTNSNRTIKANATYTKDVVSGGMALELKVPVKDLKAYANTGYGDTFTLKAKRMYIDSEYIEKQKILAERSVKTEGTELYNDFTGEFEITFTFVYTQQQIAEIIEGKNDTDYVSLYARIPENGINAGLRYFEVVENALGEITEYRKATRTMQLSELPIGTYDFVLSYDDTAEEYSILSAGAAATFNGKRFTYVGDEKNKDTFKEKLSDGKLLFDDRVLNGLYTIDSEQTKYNKRTKADSDDLLFSGQEIYYADGQDHVTGYIADADTVYADRTLTYYLGTDKNYSGTGTNRGKTVTREKDTYPDEDVYLDDRLGILVLSLGDDELAVDKTVDRTSNADDYTMLWKFDITLKSPELLSNTGKISYKANYFDYEDIDSDGKAYFKDKVFADGMEEDYDFYEAFAMGENGSIDAVSRDKSIYPETVTFSLQSETKDNGGNYTYTATVYLTHYQKVLIQGMGWEYGIDEPNIGYTVQETGDKENIYEPYLDHYDVYMTKNGTAQPNTDRRNKVTGYLGENGSNGTMISYTNTFPYFILPGNGGAGTHWYMITGICLILMSVLMFGYLYYRDRRHKRAKAR